MRLRGENTVEFAFGACFENDEFNAEVGSRFLYIAQL